MQFIDKSLLIQAAKEGAQRISVNGNDLVNASSSASADDGVGITQRDRSTSDDDFFKGIGNINEKIASEMDEVRTEVTDQVDLLDQKITAMRDLMTKNMDTLRKHIMSLPLTGSPFQITNMDLGLSYDEIKRQIEDKTKLMLETMTSEKERNAINIELEKLYVLLESTPEYKAEEEAKTQEKRRLNEPIDKKALEEMRARYSESGQMSSLEAKARFAAVPALKLILDDKAEIIKKHANDWKFITINELTADEMRAIRANLPNFGRHQIRQLAWVKGLENRIERVESGIEKVQSIPKAGPPKLGNLGGSGQPSFLTASQRQQAPPPHPPDVKRGRAGLVGSVSPPPRPNQFLSAIADKNFTLKKVVSFKQEKDDEK